ncbi:MAG: nitroreductase family deazaflavin-dependent oxidoreductase [Acidimicrobiia bacterium]|nr:nitroreductase family deazaflavin-dependent oxidoreductase [Acidimicrobiia bacterium]MDH4306927.1 nitroreductase family deazaflavin-dependent oxidoreductase [Acidimicrobiia bacterium]
MNVSEALGLPPPAPTNRLLAGFATSRAGAWISARTAHLLDRALARTGHMTHPLAVLVTTTGAKSAEPRTSPLLAIPWGDDVCLIGSGFGQRPTPGWVYNLEAHPEATISKGSKSVEVHTRRAHGDEKAAIFEAAARIYPGYAIYPKRAAHREIRVFVASSA